ncbi:MAG: hypothetical protein GX201_11400 [Clostridiales bacterium]|nr:hypothetical protein [Clostridiales bacterium]
MSNTVVIYQSKYGATKKYAQWLAEELSCDLIETKKASIEQLEKYDVIMSWKDKTLCNLLKKAVAKKDPDTYEPWEAALMQAVGQSCDWTDKKNIKEIVVYVKKS